MSASPIRERRRFRARGVVQGVGFRPFVYRLAQAHGLGGYVLNDGDGVVIEVEGAELDAFADELMSGAPSLASVDLGDGRAGRAARRDRLQDRRERRLGPRRSDPARRRHLRRVPPRALRPGRPPLPLPVHQLHAVRPALHDRPHRALRPPEHDDGRLPAVPRVPTRVRGSARPPLPRRADRLPRLRAAALDAARGGGRGARRRAGSSRSRASAATTWPAMPRDEDAVSRLRGEEAPGGEAVRRDVRPARAPRPREQGGAEAPPVAGAPDRPPAGACRARPSPSRSRPGRRGSA